MSSVSHSQRAMVVVGGGLAGVQAAAALRELGYDERVAVVTSDSDLPYDHVPLSKDYLSGKPGWHSLYLRDEDFYAERGIELHRGSVVDRVDTQRRDLVLTSGKRIRYEALLLATGAEPVRWRGPGSDLAGVHYLRTLRDARELRSQLRPADDVGGMDQPALRVVVLGSGWIGCEVAASARELGHDVTLVGRAPLPLQRQLGPAAAQFFAELHRERGVQLISGHSAVALVGPGRVEQVLLDDGAALAADIVVVGIGARPRLSLAESAGATIASPAEGGGIRTDEYLATSVPGIYAAGDCASVHNTFLGRHVRSGHYSAAYAQGPAAARSMMGARDPYWQVPFFFSDQYSVWMEYTGEHRPDDTIVVREVADGRGSVERREFITFWLRDGRLTAGMNVNLKGVPEQIRRLIASGSRVDPDALTNPDMPLGSLVVE